MTAITSIRPTEDANGATVDAPEQHPLVAPRDALPPITPGIFRSKVPTDDAEAMKFISEARAHPELQQLGVNTVICDLELFKFWVGAKHHSETAHKRLATTLAWRRDINLPHVAGEDFSDLDAAGKLFKLPRPTKEGYTVLVWRSRFHAPEDDASLQRLARYFVKHVHLLWKLGYHSDRVVVIIDRDGAESKNRDLNMAKVVSTTFNTHFPEILEGLYVFPSSWFTSACWAIIRPFVDPVTAAKVHFLSGPAMHEQLAAMMDADAVPTRWGGTWTGEPAGRDPFTNAMVTPGAEA
ncbi:hypothetical protein GGF31_001019 [Allomyces arbusculus]|nr:hypothetical protein GGF31_001019 [Allomyces arbusculus]